MISPYSDGLWAREALCLRCEEDVPEEDVVDGYCPPCRKVMRFFELLHSRRAERRIVRFFGGYMKRAA